MTGVQTWTTRHGDTVEIYRAEDGFRYRVQARNGENVEQGSEAYTRADDAAEAASRHHPIINDLTERELLDQAIEHVTDDDGEEITPEDLIEVTR